MTSTDLTDVAVRLIRGRRATRAFLPDRVPHATIESIFSLAAAAPSNSNTQPWTVEVVSGAKREELSSALVEAAAAGPMNPDFAFERYTGVVADRSFRAGALMYGALGVERDDLEGRRRVFVDGFRFYGAPHVALLFAPADARERMAGDLGIYAQTALLAMTAHGVASCPQGSLGLYPDVVREVLGIEDRKVLLGISFGYADPAAPVNAVPVPRAELAETTTFHE